MPTNDHNIWVMLFDHTPKALKWLLTILTFGLYMMARKWWHRNQERILAIETRERNYATKSDIHALRGDISGLHGKVDQVLFHMIGDK